MAFYLAVGLACEGRLLQMEIRAILPCLSSSTWTHEQSLDQGGLAGFAV